MSDRRVEWTQQGYIAHDEKRGLAYFAPMERDAVVGLDSVTALVQRLVARWAEWHEPIRPEEP